MRARGKIKPCAYINAIVANAFGTIKAEQFALPPFPCGVGNAGMNKACCGGREMIAAILGKGGVA
jgi:hypothetical protein